MPTQLGINGFGRIGRLVMRAALDNPGKTTSAADCIAGIARYSSKNLFWQFKVPD
jgi:glyceraldehyde-3-phosphate dehydrogenase/erythrose-4-phosphate dehydrogenase